MDAKKIATFVVFPLVVLAGVYLVYRIADTLFFESTTGVMTFVSDGENKSAALSDCMLGGDFSNSQLVITDGDGAGVLVEKDTSDVFRIRPILDGKAVLDADCEILMNSLKSTSFTPGSSIKLHRMLTSWKGSMNAKCNVANGEVELSVKVHACR